MSTHESSVPVRCATIAELTEVEGNVRLALDAVTASLLPHRDTTIIDAEIDGPFSTFMG